MEKLVNLNLFTIPNTVAIGAIVFFWGCVSFAVKDSVASAS
jgi:hypothetical protein